MVPVEESVITSISIDENSDFQGPYGIETGDSYKDLEKIMKEKGKLATLVIYVQYRQNSTWQGELFWAEKNLVKRFQSVLELLKLTDRIIENSRNFRLDNRAADYIYRMQKEEGGVGA